MNTASGFLAVFLSGALGLPIGEPPSSTVDNETAATTAAAALLPSQRVWRARQISIMPPMDNYPPHYRIDFEALTVSSRLAKYASVECLLPEPDSTWSCRLLAVQWLVSPLPTAQCRQQ